MIVYFLIDPRNSECRYIGKTERTAWRRLRRHVASSYLNGDTYKERWIRQLLALKTEPEIWTVETCQSRLELNESEKFWIAYMRSIGARLTNATDGGDGATGTRHSAETIELIRRKTTGKRRSPEQIERIRSSIIGRKASEATKAKLRIVRSQKRKPLSDEHRTNISRGRGSRAFVDQFGRIYRTQHEASRELGLNIGHLNEVLHGKRRSVSGYVFRFVESADDERP